MSTSMDRGPGARCVPFSNRACPAHPSKKDSEVLGRLVVDRLSVESYVHGDPSEIFRNVFGGVTYVFREDHRTRNRGDREQRQWSGRVLSPDKGPGAGYWSVTSTGPHDRHTLRFEYNPQTSTPGVVDVFVKHLRDTYPARWNLHRLDLAFDYATNPQGWMVVGDGRTKHRVFTSRGYGVETAEPAVRAQAGHPHYRLYSKDRERKDKGDDGPVAYPMRFELELRSLPDVFLSCRREGETLTSMSNPVPDQYRLVRRWCTTTRNPAWAACGLALQYEGFDSALFYARSLMSRKEVDQWLSCAMAEISPSPGQLFTRHWSDVVRRDLAPWLE